MPITPTQDLGLNLIYDSANNILRVGMPLTSNNDWLCVDGMNRLVQVIEVLFYTAVGADIQNPLVGNTLLEDEGQPIVADSVYENQMNMLLSDLQTRQAGAAASNYLSLDEQLDQYDATASVSDDGILSMTLVITNKAGTTQQFSLSLPL